MGSEEDEGGFFWEFKGGGGGYCEGGLEGLIVVYGMVKHCIYCC